MSTSISRREFLKDVSIAGAGFLTASAFLHIPAKLWASTSSMKLGLVTYLWGKDWDVPTLIANCEKADFAAIELRAHHAHGVEPSLSAAERDEVRKRFADSPVTCVGYGSNQEYHSPDPDELQKQIEGTYELIKLCHDIGASGLKVKPNTLPDGVEPEKSIAQIGSSLNKVGKYAQNYGQEIRVEVHGRKTSLLPVMKKIFEHVYEPNVGICWNCNDQDLADPGLEANFDMVKKWFGSTVHVREFDVGNYPYQQLFNLFTDMGYRGWILLEARTEPKDRVKAMKEQKRLFEEMINNA